MAPIGRVIESYGIGYHQFADDTQLFVAVDTADSADLTYATDAVHCIALHCNVRTPCDVGSSRTISRSTVTSLIQSLSALPPS